MTKWQQQYQQHKIMTKIPKSCQSDRNIEEMIMMIPNFYQKMVTNLDHINRDDIKFLLNWWEWYRNQNKLMKTLPKWYRDDRDDSKITPSPRSLVLSKKEVCWVRAKGTPSVPWHTGQISACSVCTERIRAGTHLCSLGLRASAVCAEVSFRFLIMRGLLMSCGG